MAGVFRVSAAGLIIGPRDDDRVTLGRSDRQVDDMFDDVARFCEGSLPGSSVYGFLARERDRLFPEQTVSDT